MTKSSMKTVVSWLGLAMLGMCMALVVNWSTPSQAEGELDDGLHHLPYQGRLQHDGEPFHGTVDLFVVLEGEQVRKEVHPAVTVYGGKFSIQLGAGTTISDGDGQTAFSTTETEGPLKVALGIRSSDLDTSLEEEAYTFVTDSESGDYVYQQIFGVPFAHWSATSSDFHVDGAANLTGLDVDGSLRLLSSQTPQVSSLSAAEGHAVTMVEGASVKWSEEGVSASISSAQDGDLTIAGEGLAGFRFKVNNDTVMEMTSEQATVYQNLYVNEGSTLDVDGTFNPFVVEDEVTKDQQARPTSNDTNLGRNNGRRFCALTGFNHDPDYNTMQSNCEIEARNNRFYLAVETRNLNGDDTMRCKARCLRW